MNVRNHGSYSEEEVEVFNPFQANHINNFNSLKPREPETVPYDIPVNPEEGPFAVTATVYYRSFPPRSSYTPMVA